MLGRNAEFVLDVDIGTLNKNHLAAVLQKLDDVFVQKLLNGLLRFLSANSDEVFLEGLRIERASFSTKNIGQEDGPDGDTSKGRVNLFVGIGSLDGALRSLPQQLIGIRIAEYDVC